MKLSIITPLYETKKIFDKILISVIENTTCPFEYLIVYNHPPYSDLLPYLKEMARRFPEIKILDPGKNIGCHIGCNYGFQESQGDFLVKLDADTEIRRNNKWAQIMMDTFKLKENLALLAPEVISCFSKEPLRQGGNYEPEKVGNYNLDVKKDGVLGFSSVMFTRKVWEKFGPMRSHYYVDGQPITREFYGGEEVDYSTKARDNGLDMAIIKEVEMVHLGRSEGTDPAFGVWKFFYGLAKTPNDMQEWIRNFNYSKAEFKKECKSFNYPEVQIDQAYKSIMKRKNES